MPIIVRGRKPRAFSDGRPSDGDSGAREHGAPLGHLIVGGFFFALIALAYYHFVR